jgi:hypothetical protein
MISITFSIKAERKKNNLGAPQQGRRKTPMRNEKIQKAIESLILTLA